MAPDQKISKRQLIFGCFSCKRISARREDRKEKGREAAEHTGISQDAAERPEPETRPAQEQKQEEVSPMIQQMDRITDMVQQNGILCERIIQRLQDRLRRQEDENKMLRRELEEIKKQL